ncbi:MAG: penicillin-binding protein activator LpoB [Gemmatimonadetes bacterium]|nr:penicillin-binding protein activator LpoB [Gemmatimonadota bacterium]
MNPLLTAAVAVALCMILPGCGGKTVTRLDQDTVTDLSGRWNDTDSRIVAEEMIRDCLSRPWIRQHVLTEGRIPVIVVGAVRNKTMEHIPVDTFIKSIEREFINSGDVKVVADAGERADIRTEREEMRGNVTAETLKRFGRETGADFVLTGAIQQIVDEEGRRKVSFYQTDLELIHVESNEKKWIGTKRIKKDIDRARFSG